MFMQSCTLQWLHVLLSGGHGETLTTLYLLLTQLYNICSLTHHGCKVWAILVQPPLSRSPCDQCYTIWAVYDITYMDVSLSEPYVWPLVSSFLKIRAGRHNKSPLKYPQGKSRVSILLSHHIMHTGEAHFIAIMNFRSILNNCQLTCYKPIRPCVTVALSNNPLGETLLAIYLLI